MIGIDEKVRACPGCAGLLALASLPLISIKESPTCFLGIGWVRGMNSEPGHLRAWVRGHSRRDYVVGSGRFRGASNGRVRAPPQAPAGPAPAISALQPYDLSVSCQQEPRFNYLALAFCSCRKVVLECSVCEEKCRRAA